MELGVEPGVQVTCVASRGKFAGRRRAAVGKRIVPVEIEEDVRESVPLECCVGLGWAGEGKAAISLPRLRCKRVPVRWGKRPVVLVGAPLLGPRDAE